MTIVGLAAFNVSFALWFFHVPSEVYSVLELTTIATFPAGLVLWKFLK